MVPVDTPIDHFQPSFDDSQFPRYRQPYKPHNRTSVSLSPGTSTLGMSCVHYQSSNPPKEKSYFDGPYNSYVPPTYSPRGRTPEAYRTGYCAAWRPLEYQGSNVETPTAARGDLAYAEPRMQSARMAMHSGQMPYKQDTMKHGDALAAEKMQTKIKFLEDSNIVMQTRNQNLIHENKALASQLKEERGEVKRLEKRLVSLREELDFQRSKLEEMAKQAEQAEKKNKSAVHTAATSTTNVLSTVDRGVQIWAVCMACERKLESCEKQPPTVTITKSELEILEKDMQTLRDTIIAREEAWDKAMEREQNYRQQLTRLTTETITARHFSETRYEELKTVTNALSEREAELKSLQKDNMYLNKLIVKMYNSQQRGQESSPRCNLVSDINDKDQRFIEEIARRASSGKSKQKLKSRSSCSERTAHPSIYQNSPRDKSSKTARDQVGYLRESKR